MCKPITFRRHPAYLAISYFGVICVPSSHHNPYPEWRMTSTQSSLGMSSVQLHLCTLNGPFISAGPPSVHELLIFVVQAIPSHSSSDSPEGTAHCHADNREQTGTGDQTQAYSSSSTECSKACHNSATAQTGYWTGLRNCCACRSETRSVSYNSILAIWPKE